MRAPRTYPLHQGWYELPWQLGHHQPWRDTKEADVTPPTWEGHKNQGCLMHNEGEGETCPGVFRLFPASEGMCSTTSSTLSTCQAVLRHACQGSSRSPAQCLGSAQYVGSLPGPVSYCCCHKLPQCLSPAQIHCRTVMEPRSPNVVSVS